MADCVGCGYCCKKVTCYFGRTQGTKDYMKEKNLCEFLLEVDGRYRCRLYQEAPAPLKEAMELGMGMGEGCSSSLCNEVREALVRRLSRSKSSSPSPEHSSTTE
jgi:hypothetical protein